MKKQSRKKTVLSKEERHWERRFGALVKYRRKHHHCFVPRKWPGNPRLAEWAGEQRAMWRSGKLGSDRLRRLQRLGFAWNYQDGMWERRFIELQEYRRRHGHCQVTDRSKKYSSLANWGHFQRVQRRAGRLSTERVRRLEQIGFDWVSRGRSLEFRDSTYWETKWKRMLSELVKFKRRFGHCWVPSGRPGNPKLSRWVSRQRRLNRQGLLSQDRRRQLEALGFNWKTAASADPRWERCFLRLLEFRRRFGHCHVPAEWAGNIAMGGWVVKMRRLRRMGRLNADKVRRLNEVGFVWNPIEERQVDHDAIWSKRLAQLVAFHRKHGHWRVPTNQQRYHRLRVWMDNQRINYQGGWLSADRIQRLERVRFPWLSDRGQLLASNRPSSS